MKKNNCSHYFRLKDNIPPALTYCRKCGKTLAEFNNYEGLRWWFDWERADGKYYDWNKFKKHVRRKNAMRMREGF